MSITGSGTVSTGSGTINVINSLPGLTNWTVTTPNTPTFYYMGGYGISTVNNEPEQLIDRIGRIMDQLMLTEDENHIQALKHLTYAKAYLEKSLLDKINEKTNGDSKPN